MKKQSSHINNFIISEGSIHFGNNYNDQAIPSRVIKENSIQNIKFNIMSDRYVEENIKILEYRLWDNAIQAVFDREYHTDMLNSPSHLTFLSSLTNLQKMVYVFMHYHLSIDYNKDSKELIKVWPGKLIINMPKMIMKKNNIEHLMIIKSIKKVKEKRYKVCAETIVDNSVAISGEALIVVL